MASLVFYVSAIALACLVLRLALDAAAWLYLGRVPVYVDRLLPRRPPPPAEEALPTVLRELELTRLAAAVERERRVRQPGAYVRTQACLAAYDAQLLAGSADLGLPVPPERLPLSAKRRLEVEAELASAGLQW
ncbi:hypothetical protein [Agilicoccus flavus]|uniref:hypothetical protein n=1 Tax=Agilicoccus flavus TaxID=2775968 RepID=UPI001CF690EF|nr:hypothetical protein [Agilicoccus flavus]